MEANETNETNEANSDLTGILGHDAGTVAFEYFDAGTVARLECALPRGNSRALVRPVAERRHTEAVQAGVLLAAFGEGREDRITWAPELRWIEIAKKRACRLRAKKMISAGVSHSLATSGKTGETWSFGSVQFGNLGHGISVSDPSIDEAVPRLIGALGHTVVTQVAAGHAHSMVLASNGDVFTWGGAQNTSRGQLGHGDHFSNGDGADTRGGYWKRRGHCCGKLPQSGGGEWGCVHVGVEFVRPIRGGVG